MADPRRAAAARGPIVRAAEVGTAVLIVTSAAAALRPDPVATVHAGYSLVLFAVGTGALLWAFALGVRRSRTELVDIPGLFLLSGEVAPRPTRRRLRGLAVVEAVVVTAAASVRPFSDVAFGILAPVFGLGLMAVWAGRHGTFPARAPEPMSPPPHGHGRECTDG